MESYLGEMVATVLNYSRHFGLLGINMYTKTSMQRKVMWKIMQRESGRYMNKATNI